jgi:hypothetical protein
VVERTLHALDAEVLVAEADPAVVREVRAALVDDLAMLEAGEPRDLQRMRLQLAVLARKRQELAALVASGDVEDSVAWDLQELLDHEEARLEAFAAAAARGPGSRSGRSAALTD